MISMKVLEHYVFRGVLSQEHLMQLMEIFMLASDVLGITPDLHIWAYMGKLIQELDNYETAVVFESAIACWILRNIL